ncbi:MAG: hypothetical protein M3362_26505 [Acidobacteriota bacterium]|nr:hypothetical protein [Acidobacteriota bacterium]
MSKSSISVHQPLLIASAIMLTCLFLLGAKSRSPSSVLSQDNVNAHSKVIERENFPNPPFEIVELKATTRPLKFGEKFDDDEEWLKKINFKLKNNSDKAIVHIIMYLEFPETASTGLMMSYPLQYGQRPKVKVVTGKPISLPKGETVSVSLTDVQYNELKRFIETRQSLNSINKVIVNVPSVYFEDGTLWSGGTMYRPDATAPNGMRAMNSQ